MSIRELALRARRYMYVLQSENRTRSLYWRTQSNGKGQTLRHDRIVIYFYGPYYYYYLLIYRLSPHSIRCSTVASKVYLLYNFIHGLIEGLIYFWCLSLQPVDPILAPIGRVQFRMLRRQQKEGKIAPPDQQRRAQVINRRGGIIGSNGTIAAARANWRSIKMKRT